MKRTVLGLLGAAALAYAGLCGLVYLRQDGMLYFPAREVRITPGDMNIPYEDLSVTTEDGVRLHGWAVESEPGRPWVIHCHGNAGNVAGRIVYLQLFRALRLNGVVFDYRGYGKSEGVPSEPGLVKDAVAMRQHLVDRGVAPGSIVLYGESLGGGVATAVAANDPPAGLVLMSTFTSVPDMAAGLYPFLPVRLLSRNRFDNLERLRTLPVPKLIMHSPDDDIIPFAHGRRLFEEAAEPKKWLELSGDHNASVLSQGPQFGATLRDFVEEVTTVP